MRQRAPYLIIGVLVGIIVMQWAMPAVHGQGTVLRADQVIATDGFYLVDEDGAPIAGLWASSDGPRLGIGGLAQASVTIAATTTQSRIQMDNNGSGDVSLGCYADLNKLWMNRGASRITAENQETYSKINVRGDWAWLTVQDLEDFNEFAELAAADGHSSLRLQSPEGRRITLPSITGDLDQDQDVDLDDFFMLADNFGATSAKPVAKPAGTEAKPSPHEWDIAAEYRAKLEELRQQR